MSLLLLFAPSGGAPADPAVVLAAGVLTHKAAPAPGDLILWLTSAGTLEAKTSAGVGDRRVALVSGELTATA